MSTTPIERHWDVDGLTYAGLEWGKLGDTPVLILHGWMDHAESFAQLAPRLTGCHVIAIDLSGQGLSSHRAPHASYNIWDDLPQIAGLLDILGWQDCVLIGHSRGANIATLFAAAQPIRIRALVALDSLVPEPSQSSVVQTLRAFIEETRAQKDRAPRTFPTRRAYLDRREAQGNAPAISEALADRALMETEHGLVLRGDKRMFASSAVRLKRADLEAVMAALECPVLNIWASEGIKPKRRPLAEMAKLAETLIPTYESLEFPGDHHFHMVPETAQHIANAILDFLERHKRD